MIAWGKSTVRVWCSSGVTAATERLRLWYPFARRCALMAKYFICRWRRDWEVHYSAAKAAVIGFTKALAKELGPSGICVNCVAPGVIETEMNSHLTKEDFDCLCEETPLERLGKPEEVAKTVRFLASENADFITGQVVNVDGGMVI